jgi:hypothetical protein
VCELEPRFLNVTVRETLVGVALATSPNEYVSSPLLVVATTVVASAFAASTAPFPISR